MPRFPHTAAPHITILHAALFALCLSVPAGAAAEGPISDASDETGADADASDEKTDADVDASDKKTDSDKSPSWADPRWVLTGGFEVLVDNFEPGGSAVAGEVTLGGSGVGDWLRVGVGIFAGQGPATPLYCLVCSGTRISAAPTLRMAGLLLSTELRVPFGPVQPFFNIRQGLGLGGGLTEPVAPSLLVMFSPRVGVEVPLRSGWSVRLSAGFEAITHRWVLGEPPPLPGATRLPPSHNRMTLGFTAAKLF